MSSENTCCVIEYLQNAQVLDEERKVIEFILKTTFPQEELTVKQIRVNFMSFTGKYISQEDIISHLKYMTETMYNNGIYVITEKGHYKYLF